MARSTCSPSSSSNPKSQIPNPKSQIPNPKSQIPNPKSQIPNPKSQIPNRNGPLAETGDGGTNVTPWPEFVKGPLTGWFPVWGQDLDRPDIELPQFRLDLGAVADRDDDHPLRREIFPCRGERLIGGHRVHAFGNVRVIVEAQVVDIDLRKTRCCCQACLEAARERLRARVPGAHQLVGLHRRGGHATNLLHDF